MERDGDAKYTTNTTNYQAQRGPHSLVDCRPKCGSVIITLVEVFIRNPVRNLWVGRGQLLVRVRA